MNEWSTLMAVDQPAKATVELAEIAPNLLHLGQ